MAEKLQPGKIHGELTARGLRFGIAASRFNSFITDRLLSAAVDALDPMADILSWSVVSTGVPDWYLRREFAKARDLVSLPVTV